jgi:hypothetical protein
MQVIQRTFNVFRRDHLFSRLDGGKEDILPQLVLVYNGELKSLANLCCLERERCTEPIVQHLVSLDFEGMMED